MISLDDMHSENILFSWSKSSTYRGKLRCHACDGGRTDGKWKIWQCSELNQKPQWQNQDSDLVWRWQWRLEGFNLKSKHWQSKSDTVKHSQSSGCLYFYLKYLDEDKKRRWVDLGPLYWQEVVAKVKVIFRKSFVAKLSCDKKERGQNVQEG